MYNKLYAVVINTKDLWGIDAFIELYDTEAKAKEKLEKQLQDALEKRENTNPKPEKKELIDIISNYYKNKGQSYSIETTMDSGYYTEVRFADQKGNPKSIAKPLEMLIDLANLNTQAQVQLNKAIITQKEPDNETTKSTLKDYRNTLNFCLFQANDIILQLERKENTVWAIITEWQEENDIDIHLFHTKENAVNEMKEIFHNVLNETDLQFDSEERKKAWDEFEKAKYEHFEFRDPDSEDTGKDYGIIVQLTVK